MGDSPTNLRPPQDAIYRELLQAGYRFSVYRGVWPADAEDVAAASLAKFHRVYGAKLEELASPRALYFYVLRSCIADAARKRKLATTPLDRDVPGAAPNTASRLDAQTLIASLPTDQQEALLLIYFEGLTYPEAAKATGRSIDSLKHLRKKAIQTLRDEFDINVEAGR